MFGIEFWKIAVSLGVPGFALGILYALFSAFKFEPIKLPPRWRGPVAVLFLLLVAGVILFALWKFVPPPRPAAQPVQDDYTIRVTVLDPQGNPADDARVVSSLGGEPKKVPGGWEFSLSRAKAPADGKLTIFATVAEKSLSGKAEVSLGRELIVAVTVNLATNPASMTISGSVRDEDNGIVRAARVSQGGQTTISGEDGRFRINVDGKPGEDVRLHVESEGYAATDVYAVPGDMELVIVLKKGS